MFHRKLFFPESFPGHVRPIKKVKVPLSLGGGGGLKVLVARPLRKYPFVLFAVSLRSLKSIKQKAKKVAPSIPLKTIIKKPTATRIFSKVYRTVLRIFFK